MVGIYLIYDNLGECIVSDLFKAKNQSVAMIGFNSFIEDCKQKGLSGKNYSLYKVGDFNDEDLSFVNTERVSVALGENVHDKLVALGVLTAEVDDVTDQPDAIVLDNGEI